MQTILYSFVIPCYRSQGSINGVVGELLAEFKKECIEIILVCDASPDGTWDVLTALAKNHPNQVSAILLGRNAGQHNAILCGIRNAKGEIIVTMDDDGQHPIAAVRTVIAGLNSNVDLVYGLPMEERHGFYRNFTSILGKYILQAVTGSQRTSALRAFSGHLRGVFDAYHGHACSIDVLLSWGTNRIDYANVSFRKREIGVSNYTTGRLIRLAISMLTGYSVWPLKMAAYIGFVSTMFGVVIFSFVMWNYFVRGTNVQGFTFLAAIVSMFAGLQMFCLGVVGEYLGRMYYRTLDRPPFLVKDQFIHKSCE